METKKVFEKFTAVPTKRSRLRMTIENHHRIRHPAICYDFLNIFAEKFSDKIGFLTPNKAKLCKNLIITLVSEKNGLYTAGSGQAWTVYLGLGLLRH
jgi:hypothetical protein